MSKKIVEKRFGIIAFDKGFVTVEQVLEALELQVKENVAEKKHRRIGEILVFLGYMTDGQVDEVLQEMPGKV